MSDTDQQRLYDLMTDICEDDAVVENPDMDWFERGHMDSLSFVELLVDLGDTFNISIARPNLSAAMWPRCGSWRLLSAPKMQG